MTMEKLIETDRTYLRRMSFADRPEIASILQDEETMYAYAHAFSDEEVDDWISRQIGRYSEYGYGLLAVIRKEDGVLVGQCGLTWQDTPDGRVSEIGYLFNRRYWHCGYAIEAASAVKEFAFEKLGLDTVCSIIRDGNLPSVRVALKNGMSPAGGFTKHYYGIDMPHTIYAVSASPA